MNRQTKNLRLSTKSPVRKHNDGVIFIILTYKGDCSWKTHFPKILPRLSKMNDSWISSFVGSNQSMTKCAHSCNNERSRYVIIRTLVHAVKNSTSFDPRLYRWCSIHCWIGKNWCTVVPCDKHLIGATWPSRVPRVVSTIHWEMLMRQQS